MAWLANRVSHYDKALSANNLTNAYPTTAPTGSQPTVGTNGVIDPTEVTGKAWQTVQVLPFGGNNDNDQIVVRVVGWNRTKTSGLWVPRILAEVTATLSSSITGVAAHDVLNTEFFADDLTLTSGGIAVLYKGATDSLPAFFEVDINGSALISVQCKTGTAGDAANALYRLFS